MWMMGYNDHSMGGEFNVAADSFNGRRLRPLIPRPATAAAAASTSNTPTMNTTPCLGRIHGTSTDHHLLALNHHLMTTMSSEQNKKEYNLNSSITQQQQQQQQQIVVSSRWNPTPEQLHTLEELYQRGTRTPSADQIQHITTQLRRYGKIEGKNVFYWFQNHKARERQKRRRRQLESSPPSSNQRKESAGANRTGFEVEQTKDWAHPVSTLAERTVSIQRAAKAAAVPECRTDGWVQFDEREFQHRRSLVERNGTWQMMQLSSCSPPTHLINTSPATIRTMDPKLIKTQDLNIFIAPYREDLNYLVSVGDHEHADEASQTLQLFPLRSGDGNDNVADKETELSLAANFTTPYQFFEFLPLKN